MLLKRKSILWKRKTIYPYINVVHLEIGPSSLIAMYKAKIIPYAVDGQEQLCSLHKVGKTVSTELITTFAPALMEGAFNCWNTAHWNMGNPWLKGTSPVGSFIFTFMLGAPHLLCFGCKCGHLWLLCYTIWSLKLSFFFFFNDWNGEGLLFGNYLMPLLESEIERSQTELSECLTWFYPWIAINSAANSVLQRVWAFCCCCNRMPWT